MITPGFRVFVQKDKYEGTNGKKFAICIQNSEHAFPAYTTLLNKSELLEIARAILTCLAEEDK